MSRLFNLNIEAFPNNETIYMYFDPVEPSENDDFFEMEIERDVLALAKFLRKLKPLKDLQTPMSGYLNFAKEVFDRNIHSCYCHQDNVNSIIDAYHQRDRSPAKEFESPNDQEECVPDFITESFVLTEDALLDGVIRKAGTRLTFYHGGPNHGQ